MKRNTLLATIPSWGSKFRVSFEVKIKSGDVSGWDGWANIISFKGNGATSNVGKIGDRNPAIFFNKKGFLHFNSGVNGKNHGFNYSIKLRQWYSIIIEQKTETGKVKGEREKLDKYIVC